MSKILLMLTLGALSLSAQDATGKWSGTLARLDADSDGTSKPAYLVLKQEGTKLTGTAGPNASEQFEFSDGKAEGGHLTFKLTEKSMTFDLKQTGDEITGEITNEQDGQTRKAKITVKRQT